MAFLSTIANILPAVGSLFGSKTSGGETVSQQPMILPELKNFYSRYLNQYEPGKESGLDFSQLSQMSPFEQLGLGMLGQFLQGGGTGDLFNQASDQLSSTLSGQFTNPATNPYIQSLTTLANTNLRDQIDQSRARRGARGTYFTTDAIREEGNIQENTLNNLNAIIGNILQQERGRQFQAAPLAAQLDRFQNFDVPLSQIGASQQFGGLQRTLDTAQLEAQYQDFIRKQQELGAVPSSAAGTQFGFQDFTTPITQQPSSIQNILNLISQANQQGLFEQLGDIFKGGQ